MQLFGKKTQQIGNVGPARLRCPSCRHQGTFDSVLQNDLQAIPGGEILGIRWCPNPSCGALVFVVFNSQRNFLLAYPSERIDFDVTDVPHAVVSAMEEAISCHAAQCFTASAIMVRKTLELICMDRGATGANLKERLRALAKKIILPQELFDGLDDLRLLGNDAAHVESQIFGEIGKNELDIAIEFAKEVLKATFQYKNLVSRLKSLKRPPTEIA